MLPTGGRGARSRHRDGAPARHRAEKVYEADIAPNLVDGDSLAFAHGFNIHFEQIAPPAGRRRVDDRAEGSRPPRAPHLRRRRRRAVPGRGRERRDRQGQADRARVRGASAATRAGVLDTTFEEETETDLFGEQVVLCGGLVELIRNGYDTLVEAGYHPSRRTSRRCTR